MRASKGKLIVAIWVLTLVASMISGFCQKATSETQPCSEQSRGTPAYESIDTSDWKTYRNEKWGYSVEYPGDWEVNTVLTNFDRPEDVVKELVAFKSPDGIPTILVDLWTNDSQSSLLDWFMKIQKPVLSEGVSLPDGANTEVSGFPAIEIENPQYRACDEFVTLFLAKDGQLVFRFTYRVYDNFKTIPIYKNMLSTFEVK